MAAGHDRQGVGVDHRHRPFLIAFFLGVVSLPISIFFAPALALEISAILFFLAYLALVGWRLSGMTAARLKSHAESDDAPAPAIIAVTFLAVAVVVISLFQSLNRVATETGLALSLAFASVVLGWMTIHVMAAMHYAHLYWRPAAEPGERQLSGGMDFPHCERPNGYDFLYFALVVGMTAQTSDVAVTTTAMRKAVLLHSVVSFFFNTVLVAAAVNAAVALAS